MFKWCSGMHLCIQGPRFIKVPLKLEEILYLNIFVKSGYKAADIIMALWTKHLSENLILLMLMWQISEHWKLNCGGAILSLPYATVENVEQDKEGSGSRPGERLYKEVTTWASTGR